VPTASTPSSDNIAALRATLLAEQATRRVAEQQASGAEAIIAHLKLLIAEMRYDWFGISSGRGPPGLTISRARNRSTLIVVYASL